MTTAADIDAIDQPTRTRTTICLDSDLVLEIGRLEEAMRRAQLDDSAASQAGVIAQEIIDLRQQAIDAEVEFVFRSIGRYDFRELIRLHPATDEQQSMVKGDNVTLAFNPDMFQPALFAAACEAPSGTDVAWWTRKCRDWSDGRIARLWEVCLAAQQGVNAVPKAAAAYSMLKSASSSE